MTYRVILAPGAARTMQRLSGPILFALRGAILGLSADPRPRGSRKLAALDLYRLRLRVDGVPWRIVYQVRDAERIVLLTRVARRAEGTYRGL